MVHYKLSYFPLRGAAEVIRQIFAYAGQDFEDVRVAKEDWPVLKPNAPFGQMPILEVDGKKLAQSHAIARYLAREFKLNGQCPFEEALVNSVADQFKDYMNQVRPYFMVVFGFGEGDKQKLHEDVFVPAVKQHFVFFNNFLQESKSGYLVGKDLTWVDLLIAQHVADLVSADEKVINEFPQLIEHQKRIHSIGNIKKWIETRPQTPF